MRGLKRQGIEGLRQGAAKGRKVLWVWDRAGIDFAQWYKWKCSSGIYFVSRAKENMKLDEMAADQKFDRDDPVNAGVVHDYLWGGSTMGVKIGRAHV